MYNTYMVHSRKTPGPAILFCLFCIVVCTTLQARDRRTETAYCDSLIELYRTQYRNCTADTSEIDVETLVEWKQQVNRFVQSPEYGIHLKAYCATFGVKPLDVSPCQLVQWLQKKEQQQYETQKLFAKIRFERDQARAESLYIHNEIRSIAPSPFDFDSIPFGITKSSFVKLFEQRYEHALVDAGDYVYCQNLQWGGRPFLSAFYFGESGKLFKYVIESDTLPVDSLDSRVRPQVRYLAAIFERRFGEPAHTRRIGLFDIRESILTPYKRWNREGYTVCVGIGVHHHRYYAQAIVIDNTAADIEQRLRSATKISTP